MYSFSQRLKQIITLDPIRICKIAEIFQYSFIFLILIIAAFYSMDRFYYRRFEKKDENERMEESKKETSIWKQFFSIFFDTFIIIIILFYLRKIALLFPSIPTYVYPKFKELTTLDYSIHIALVVVLLELLPAYKEKLANLRRLIDQMAESKPMIK